MEIDEEFLAVQADAAASWDEEDPFYACDDSGATAHVVEKEEA